MRREIMFKRKDLLKVEDMQCTKNIMNGATLACIYNGRSFYVKTQNGKRIRIEKGMPLTVTSHIMTPEANVVLEGEFGGLKDEDGTYHDGTVTIPIKDICVRRGETLYLCTRERILNEVMAQEDRYLIQNRSKDRVIDKKYYNGFGINSIIQKIIA